MSAFPENLENGEFLILTDDSFHAVGKAGLQIQLTPTTIYLTNMHIFLKPQFNIEMNREISIRDIAGFDNTSVNECPVLDILCENLGQSIHIFIPDETRQEVFYNIIKEMHSRMTNSEEECNKYSIMVRKKIQEYDSLQHFYDHFLKSKMDPTQDIDEKEKKINLVFDYLKYYFKPFDFVADIIDNDLKTLLYVFVVFVEILSIVFSYYSFGVFHACLCLLLLIFSGLKHFTKKYDEFKYIQPDSVPTPLKSYVKENNKFVESFEERFLWKNPQKSLEVAIFLVILALLFILFDPLFLLVFSLIGLTLLNRWNPLLISAFSNTISHMI